MATSFSSYGSGIPSRTDKSSPYSAQQVIPVPSCGSGFECGASYKVMENDIVEIKDRIDLLEETLVKDREKKSNYIETAENLLKLQKYLLIILVIVQFVVVGIVAYFFSDSKGILITGASLIGISIVGNGFVLPRIVKDLQDRVSKIEQKLEDKL